MVWELILSASFIAGVVEIILALLNRRWRKKDTKDEKIDAIVNAQKVLMLDRVHYLGSVYIKAGFISIEEKENIKEMHKAYKKLGGNGHLDTIMEEIDKLPIKEG